MKKSLYTIATLFTIVQFAAAFSPYENFVINAEVTHAALIASVKPGQEEALDKALLRLSDKTAVKALKKSNISNLSCYKKVLGNKTWVLVYFDYRGKDYIRAGKDFESAGQAVENLNQYLVPHPRATRYGMTWLQMEWINHIRGSLDKKETHKAYSKVTSVKPEMEERYRILHQTVWPGVVDQMARGNNRNFSIFLVEIGEKIYEFLYGEYIGEDPEKDSAMDRMDPINQRWWKCTDPCQEPLPGSKDIWSPMESIVNEENDYSIQ